VREQVDAVVLDPFLAEVVGADLFGPFTRPNLCLPVCRKLGLLSGSGALI
jgi:hypothetical protein